MFRFTIRDVLWLMVGLGRRWSLACELPTHKRSAHLVTTLDILSDNYWDPTKRPDPIAHAVRAEDRRRCIKPIYAFRPEQIALG